MSEAATVAQALHELTHQPQWILLDLMLPDGSGITVLKQVKAEGISSKTCVITGCDSAMLNEARRAGAEHTFTKPLDVERLVALLSH